MQVMLRFPGLTPSGVAKGVIGMEVRDTGDLSIREPFGTGDSSDWFVWTPYQMSAESNSASIGAQGLYLDLDNRSMRKVGPRGHDIVCTVSNFGAEDVIIDLMGRMLFKS